MEKIKTTLNFIARQQFRLQGLILCIVAFIHSGTNEFWQIFPGGLILFGVQDIIDEIRRKKI